ncbi:TPA: hypothetical protein T7O95_000225 [Streptococcus suis]|nr:hypothetical protein [Streptococcus suis]HEL2712727.1 hypothetical protein [Streptococcus suis]HEM4171817.1 hypothetical protein [Streptococcus suis]
MKSVDVRVKALVTFSDSQSPIGLRRKDEEFVTAKDRADYLNGLNEEPLVAVLEEIKKLHSESVNESVSESVSELASELASEVVTTRKPRRKTSKESE